MGLPKSETIFQGIGTTTQVSRTDYYYDGVLDCNTASSNQTPDKGNLTRTVRWLSGGSNPEVRMAYDSFGNVACTRDANGNVATVSSYDSTYTYPKVTTNPLGHQTTMQYYGVDGVAADNGLYGQVKSVTDNANGTVVTTEYDPLGRKTKVTMPDGTWTSWAYNNFGTVGVQHVMTDNSLGLTSWSYFDGFGRTIKTRRDGPAGKIIVSETEYDQRGAVKRTSLPYFENQGETVRWTDYTYDPLGRTLEIRNPNNTTAKACYNDGITVAIDADGHRKRETKNVQGRLVMVEEYSGTFAACTPDVGSPYASTTYQYDVLGNLRYVTDAKGNQTEMRYDSLGRKTYMNDPDMGAWTYTYYPNGSLKTQNDAKNQTITFTYDALNRVTLKDYPTGTDVSYTYDETWSSYPKGRLTTMVDASGTAKYYYDSLGRTIKTVKTVDGSSYPVETTYTQGRMTAVKYPDGESVSYSYDTGGNLSLVSGGSVSYANYGNYNALGQPGTITNGNGAATTYQYYSANNRLKNITTSGVSALLNLTYDYYAGGNIKTISDGIVANRSQTFQYDDLNRLLQAQSTAYGTLSYVYDQIGNFLSKEGITYDQYGLNAGPHAVTHTSDGNSYLYDVNGNMTTDGTRAITYDYDNMPSSVTIGGQTTSFVYDGNGARVKKITPTGTIIYIGKLYECNSGTCSKYIFGGGTRIAQKSGSQVVYYHQDHLGSGRAMTDGNGNKIEDLYYYPFGDTQSDTGGVSMNHRYTSQELDSETGLYYYNARYYNSKLGRFISADTIVPSPSNPQAFNRYSYVLNNPLSFTDPSGHWSTSHLWHEITRPQNAVAVQLLLPGVGTVLLTQSQAGRNILAGEIVAGTAVATFYCGGCGAVASGALAGELVGGYSAYRAGGDVLSGVAVGGVLGGATGYMAGGIGTETGSFWAQAGKNFAAGAIKGAGIGAAAGYAGGKGTARSILTDAAIGAAIGGSLQSSKVLMFGRNITADPAVQDAIARGESGYGVDFSNVTVREGGALEYLRPGTDAITLGNSINVNVGLSSESYFGDLMQHELYHVVDYGVQGFVPFVANYLVNSITHGYWDNPAEVDARAASGY